VKWTSLSSDELLEACLESSGEPAWEEFVRRFHPLIAATVIRVARRFGESAPDLIDELIQDTYLKICANRCRILREFQPQAPDAIFGLLKTVAFSVAIDHFRSRLAGKHGAGQPEFTLDKYVGRAVTGRDNPTEAERAVLLREIDDLLIPGADPATGMRDRQIFWLYYRHGMTSRAIAAIPALGLTQKGIESVIQRLTEHVRGRLVESEMQNLEGKRSANPL
jgi:RNA polymerase sigma-70 factor (ECF subfamily)